MKHLHPFSRLTAGLFAALIPMTAIQQTVLSVSAASSSQIASAEAAIRNAWTNLQTTPVDFSRYSMTLDEVTALYSGMLYTESEWFYVKSFFYQADSRGIVQKIQVNYNYDTATVRQKQSELNQRIAEITAGINPGWSTAETVLYLHDVLIDGCEYDFTVTHGDAYAALVGGSAVCQGYALAMNLLCREVGIPCYSITSDNLNHMWNVVCVDGEWYQFDATNDDFAPNMIGHARHDYVLCSDAFMMADSGHSASDWNYFTEGQTISCTSTEYDSAFWIGALDTVEVMPDGTFVYADSNIPGSTTNSAQIHADFKRGSLTVDPVQLFTVNKAYWYTPDGHIYTACYVCTDVYGDMIYYHTPKEIYKIPLAGGSAELVYRLTADEQETGSLYGIRIDDSTGILTYQIMNRADFENMSDPLNPPVVPEFGTIQLDVPVISETTTESTTTTTESTTTTTTTTTTETESTTTTTTVTETEPTTTTTESDTTTTTTESTVPTAAETETTTTLTETTTTLTETTTTVTATTTETESETTTTTAAPVMTLRGDTDCSGEVNVLDAVLLARVAAEDIHSGITDQGKVNADCDLNGSVGSEDLTWLLRYLAHLITY